jgi:hypothetical protein
MQELLREETATLAKEARPRIKARWYNALFYDLDTQGRSAMPPKNPAHRQDHLQLKTGGCQVRREPIYETSNSVRRL